MLSVQPVLCFDLSLAKGTKATVAHECKENAKRRQKNSGYRGDENAAHVCACLSLLLFCWEKTWIQNQICINYMQSICVCFRRTTGTVKGFTWLRADDAYSRDKMYTLSDLGVWLYLLGKDSFRWKALIVFIFFLNLLLFTNCPRPAQNIAVDHF